jgi:hypothetical protein
MPFLDLPDDNYLDDRYRDDRDDDDDAQRCEACGVNLDDASCLCGPAGPRVDGVWTGMNSRTEE